MLRIVNTQESHNITITNRTLVYLLLLVYLSTNFNMLISYSSYYAISVFGKAYLNANGDQGVKQ